MADFNTDYQFPSFLNRMDDASRADDRLLGHVKEIKTWGQSFIESQPAWDEITRAYDILRRDTTPTNIRGSSTISVNQIRRDMKDLVASISNLRPMENAVSHNPQMKEGISKLNKLCKHWWLNTFQDRKYRKAVQYAVGLGTAYLSPWWDNNANGYGRGEIAVKTYGPSRVLPVMMTEDFDLQKAYAVTVVEETPIHIVLANFPGKAHRIQPSRNMPGWMEKGIDTVKRATNGVMGILETPQKPVRGQMPTVDVNYTYILDPSVNNTGKRIAMGKPGTSWFYEVPYIGERIESSIRDIQGNPLYRDATDEDCRLFPLRRLVVWTETCILQDDTSPWLHGRVPLVKLTVDDYPWDFLGYSIVHDTWKVQKGRNKMLRAFSDSLDVRLEPPMKVDDSLSDALMLKLQMRKPGQYVKLPMGIGDPMAPLMPVQHWDVPAWCMQLYTMLGEEQSKLALVKDLMALAKAKQVPSSDSIEKILENLGPAVQDIARGGEQTTCDFAMLWFPLALQFYDSRRKIKVFGDDGISKEDIDYDPGTMVPSHLPGEDRSRPSLFQNWQRIRWTIEQLSYEIEPYSQAQVSRIGRNLVLLQLFKMGFPVGPWTIGKGLGLNMGDPPKKRDGSDCVTQLDEWQTWREIQAAHQVELQQLIGQATGQQGQGPGRPATNQAPPQIKQKDGGTRSTLATSR